MKMELVKAGLGLSLGLSVMAAHAQGCGGGERPCDPVPPNEDVSSYLYLAVAPVCAGLSDAGLKTCVAKQVLDVATNQLGCKQVKTAAEQRMGQFTLPLVVVSQAELYRDCNGGSAIFAASVEAGPAAANVGLVCGPNGGTAAVGGGPVATVAYGLYQADRGDLYCAVSAITGGGSIRYTMSTEGRPLVNF